MRIFRHVVRFLFTKKMLQPQVEKFFSNTCYKTFIFFTTFSSNQPKPDLLCPLISERDSRSRQGVRVQRTQLS